MILFFELLKIYGRSGIITIKKDLKHSDLSNQTEKMVFTYNIIAKG